LDNPDEVNQYVLTLPISDAYKAQLTQVYAKYCEYKKIPYNRPRFKRPPSKPIRIPTEEKINMIIAESGKLQAHITRYSLTLNDNLFRGSEEHYGEAYRKVRDRLAKKLQNPSFRTIRLYDLRHYFATMLYHKTKDILLVKQQLGHKSINNTLVYIDLETTLFNTKDEYTCKAVDNKEDAMKLIENGFQYVMEVDGYKILRKRK